MFSIFVWYVFCSRQSTFSWIRCLLGESKSEILHDQQQRRPRANTTIFYWRRRTGEYQEFINEQIYLSAKIVYSFWTWTEVTVDFGEQQKRQSLRSVSAEVFDTAGQPEIEYPVGNITRQLPVVRALRPQSGKAKPQILLFHTWICNSVRVKQEETVCGYSWS